MLTDSKGVSAFPDLGPLGGSINQIPVLVSEGVTAGNVVLVDGSGIAAASGDLVLNEFREGMMQHSKPVLRRWIRGAKSDPETSRSSAIAAQSGHRVADASSSSKLVWVVSLSRVQGALTTCNAIRSEGHSS